MILSVLFGMPVMVAGQYYSRVNVKDGFLIIERDGHLLILKGESVTMVYTTNVACCLLDGMPTAKERKNGKQ